MGDQLPAIRGNIDVEKTNELNPTALILSGIHYPPNNGPTSENKIPGSAEYRIITCKNATHLNVHPCVWAHEHGLHINVRGGSVKITIFRTLSARRLRCCYKPDAGLSTGCPNRSSSCRNRQLTSPRPPRLTRF